MCFCPLGGWSTSPASCSAAGTGQAGGSASLGSPVGTAADSLAEVVKPCLGSSAALGCSGNCRCGSSAAPRAEGCSVPSGTSALGCPRRSRRMEPQGRSFCSSCFSSSRSLGTSSCGSAAACPGVRALLKRSAKLASPSPWRRTACPCSACALGSKSIMATNSMLSPPFPAVFQPIHRPGPVLYSRPRPG